MPNYYITSLVRQHKKQQQKNNVISTRVRLGSKEKTLGQITSPQTSVCAWFTPLSHVSGAPSSLHKTPTDEAMGRLRLRTRKCQPRAKRKTKQKKLLMRWRWVPEVNIKVWAREDTGTGEALQFGVQSPTAAQETQRNQTFPEDQLFNGSTTSHRKTWTVRVCVRHRSRWTQEASDWSIKRLLCNTVMWLHILFGVTTCATTEENLQ